MSYSTKLALPFLTLGQAQKHVTVNESLLRLDAVVQLSVVSATTTAQPASPSDGQAYILPSGKTGAYWDAMNAFSIAYYRDGIWEQITPHEGWLAYIQDTDKLCAHTGAAWSAFSADKLLTVTATDKILGRVSSGAGAAEEVTFTDQAQQLCDDASFAAMRATMAAAGTGDANVFTSAQTIQTSAATALMLQNDDNSAAAGPVLSLYRNSASPAASDTIGFLSFDGKDSTGATTTYGSLRGFIADPVDGSEDGEFQIATLVAGASGTRVRIGAGIFHTSATGGDKGANTINFGAVYDDNVLLTCGPIELLNQGKIDWDKWDELTPNIEHPAETKPIFETRTITHEIIALDQEGREQRLTQQTELTLPIGETIVRAAHTEERAHPAMALQRAMMEAGFDPRDPENFCARLKQDGAVPGLLTETEWRDMRARGEKPDIGAMLTRTFLAMDNLAVAFAGAVERIAALEARA